MASDGARAALETALAAVEEDAGHVPEVATFIVGDRKFKILEQTINLKGQTLLSDLLNDPSRTDKAEPIYVEGDSERFRYILDWYRFGSIKLPSTVSVAEMKRECTFYGLPEDVTVQHEHAGHHVRAVHAARAAVRAAASEEWTKASASAAVRAAFDLLVQDEGLWNGGTAVLEYLRNAKPDMSDMRKCSVWSAVFEGDMECFKTGLATLASPHGLVVKCQHTQVPVNFPNKGIGKGGWDEDPYSPWTSAAVPFWKGGGKGTTAPKVTVSMAFAS